MNIAFDLNCPHTKRTLSGVLVAFGKYQRVNEISHHLQLTAPPSRHTSNAKSKSINPHHTCLLTLSEESILKPSWQPAFLSLVAKSTTTLFCCGIYSSHRQNIFWSLSRLVFVTGHIVGAQCISGSVCATCWVARGGMWLLCSLCAWMRKNVCAMLLPIHYTLGSLWIGHSCQRWTKCLQNYIRHKDLVEVYSSLAHSSLWVSVGLYGHMISCLYCSSSGD